VDLVRKSCFFVPGQTPLGNKRFGSAFKAFINAGIFLLMETQNPEINLKKI
jgi:hypothetical protein